ncbi:MAG: tetratricopeptide repeat protein [Acidobacteriota bacterium]
MSIRRSVRRRRPIAPSLVLAVVAAAFLAGVGSAQDPAAAGRSSDITLETVTALDGAVGGVAVDALGWIYVADFGERVWKIDPFGKVEVLADSLYGTSGNALDSAGVLYQSSFYGDQIHRIHRDGSVELFASGLEGPVGVVVLDDGTVFATNCRGNWIARITADGAVERFAESELLSCPNGLARGPDGSLYIVNFNGGNVLRLTIDGENAGAIERFATIPQPGLGHGAFVGTAFYVTGFRSNRVFRIDPDGTVQPVIGSGAFGEDDGVGLEVTMASPNGIAYDARRDALYVNDYRLPWPQRLAFAEPPHSALRRIRLPSLNDVLVPRIEAGDVEGAVAAARAFRADRPGRVNLLSLNAVGYRLLQAGDVEAAVALFQLNTEWFPGEANPWDSLGEALALAGRRDEAIRAYETALERAPEMPTALQALERLRSGD